MEKPVSTGGVDDRARVTEEAKAGSAVAAGSEPEGVMAFAPVSAAEAMSLELSPAQQKAIERLTSGATIVEAALAAGVGRTTLYRWLKGDAKFTAAFNAWQQDAIATSRARLLALSDLAVTTVSRAMNRGDAKTAVAVLKSLGVMERPVVGSTDAEEISREREAEDGAAAARRARDAKTLAARMERIREVGGGWSGRLE